MVLRIRALDKKPGIRTGRLSIGPYVIGISLFVIIGFAIHNLQSTGRSAAAIAMAKDMDMRNVEKFWAFPFLQSSGLVAILLSYVTALLGLGRAALKEAGGTASATMNHVHRHVSLCVVGLVLIHMLTTALDAMGDNWRTVLIPGTWAHQGWPEAVWGYNLGIAAAYILILVGPTFYIRRILAPTHWLTLHHFAAFFYLFSLWHAMILGLDLAYYQWLRPMIWLAQIPLLGLLMKRLYRPAFTSSSSKVSHFNLSRISCLAVFVMCTFAIAVLLFVVITGKSDFIETV